MEFLINPNVAYLLIVASFLLMLISIVIPGTGMPEIGFMVSLIAATYFAYRLGINTWAIVILILSVVPFLVALRQKTGRIVMLITSILLLTGGSIFLFTGANGFPLVNPVLAVIVSVGSGGFIWLSADRATKVLHQPLTHNLDTLIGKIGQARTNIHAEGSVQVDGEMWSACSEKPIKTKSLVRIIRRDGLILTVEEQAK